MTLLIALTGMIALKATLLSSEELLQPVPANVEALQLILHPPKFQLGHRSESGWSTFPYVLCDHQGIDCNGL